MDSYDTRHAAAIVNAKSLGSSNPIFGKNPYRLRIGGEACHESLPIDSFLVPGCEGSKRLIVAFHGAINRRDVQIPRYEWLTQLSRRTEHKLFISDTTLELADDLNLAWYLGTPKFDLIAEITAFIEKVRSVNKIDEIVLLGSSGGGFASLAIGSKINKSCSISFSPQSNVWDFSDGHSQKFKDTVFCSDNCSTCLQKINKRTDLISYYADGRHFNNYIYYQNTGDIEHVQKHWRRFAASQGVRLLSGGRSFNQQGIFVSKFDAKGHARPPVEEMDSMIEMAFAMSSNATSFIKDSESTGYVFDYDVIMDPVDMNPVPSSWLYYHNDSQFRLPPESENLSYTSKGIPQRIISGITYDHPVLQAQIALKYLNNCKQSGSVCVNFESMEFVRATLSHLLEYSLDHEAGYYFPFKFPWHQDNLQPPWYSAMAQGQVLQLACRYAEKTGSDEFNSFADRIFSTFLHLRSMTDDEVGVVHIDSEGYLWLEEYPYPRHNKFVLNGHIFAALGVYEYWRMTGSDVARSIFVAAISTVRRYLEDFRNKGWASHYDLRSRLLLRNYHSTHISLIEHLYAITGDNFFSRAADLFEDDFPGFQGRGRMRITAGKHKAVRADNSRVPTKILKTEDLYFESSEELFFTVRTKIESELGVWLYVEDEGPYQGLWFKEEAGSVFPQSKLDQKYYNRPRSAICLSNKINLNEFDKNGSAINSREIETIPGAVIDVIGKALWNGVWHALVTTGTSKDASWHRIESGDIFLV